MTIKRTTQVPNVILDAYLPLLTEAELKVMLVVIRQTAGWMDRSTGKRKERDRISGMQFRQKTGLSKRIITKATQSLCDKELLAITDFNGNILCKPLERKGKSYLFYSMMEPAHIVAKANVQNVPAPVHISGHNKTKRKESRTKANGFTGHIGLVLEARMPMPALEKNAS